MLKVLICINYCVSVFAILCNEVHLKAFIKLNVSLQFMAATRSGLFGLSVVRLVVQERNTVIVPAQILGQHTEDDGVAALNHGEKH